MTMPSLLALIREDLSCHQGRPFAPGFQAVAAYRFGHWGLQQPKLIRKACTAVFAVIYTFIKNVYGIELPSSARVGRRLHLGHQHGLIIHPFAEIGDDCMIRHGVTLGVAGAGREWTDAPRIGNGVEISPGAVIIGDIHIGDGARIGPNAVVINDVPAGATVWPKPPRVLLKDAGETAEDPD